MIPAVASVPVQVQVDATDPLVAVLAWAISAALSRYLGRRARRYRHAVPTVAVLVAVALRAAYAQGMDQPIDLALLLRAVAAGAAAVLGHSQFREIGKLTAKDRDTVEPRSKGDGKDRPPT